MEDSRPPSFELELNLGKKYNRFVWFNAVMKKEGTNFHSSVVFTGMKRANKAVYERTNERIILITLSSTRTAKSL